MCAFTCMCYLDNRTLWHISCHLDSSGPLDRAVDSVRHENRTYHSAVSNHNRNQRGRSCKSTENYQIQA